MKARLNEIITRERTSFSSDVWFAAALVVASLLAYYAVR